MKLLKRIAIAVCAVMLLVMGFALSACNDDYENPAPASDWGNILVVYFSKTQTTERVALTVQEVTGADIFEVERLNPYPDAYTPTTEEAKRELDAGERPELKEYLSEEAIAEYDTIIVGFPIWWHTAPMPILSFLEHYDLSGKNIVTFCTSGGSDIDESTPDIVKSCPDSTVYEGRRFTSAGESGVRSWLESLNII